MNAIVLIVKTFNTICSQTKLIARTGQTHKQHHNCSTQSCQCCYKRSHSYILLHQDTKDKALISLYRAIGGTKSAALYCEKGGTQLAQSGVFVNVTNSKVMLLIGLMETCQHQHTGPFVNWCRMKPVLVKAHHMVRGLSATVFCLELLEPISIQTHILANWCSLINNCRFLFLKN